MTDQPEHKTCLACQQVFYRRTVPRDTSFRWMRRKYCSVACARTATRGNHPARLAAPRAGEGES